MRAAVYDRYWTTLGGGELYAATIARVLLDRAMDVDLVGFDAIDPAVLSERLDVDLRDTGAIVAESEHEVSTLSADYDLFVNATYLSNAVNLARRGLFVAHFPSGRPARSVDLEDRIRLAMLRHARRPWLRWIDGLHHPESAGTVAWTNGQARLLVWLPSEGDVSFDLSSRHWPAGHVPDALVKVGSAIRHRGPVEPAQPVHVTLRVPLLPPERPLAIVISSDAFLPARLLGTTDGRQLGLQVTNLRVNGRRHGLRPVARVGRRHQLSYLDSYDAITANSRFTAQWIHELWGRECSLLYPLVAPRTSGAKERMILSVGRFFAPERGHSKKQLELVEAFRRACERGLRGWSLHLVGGCSAEDRAYAMSVKRSAVGLPVHVYLNASSRRLDDLYARSALFWHAAGYEEELSRYPERFEHFGISVAEAVTAGCIPLVFAIGGPPAIIADVPRAEVWHELDELVDKTRQLTDAFDQGRLDPVASPLPVARPWAEFDRFSAVLDELLGLTPGGRRG